MEPVRIKICGVTSIDDAEAAFDAGCDLIGLNFWPGSKRRCDLEEATEIVERMGAFAGIFGVFVDEDPERIRQVVAYTGVHHVQLHGQEPPEVVRAIPRAFKALRVAGEDIESEAARYPGELVLLDASVEGMVGGTGRTFDWSLAAPIARERKVLLAGGLTRKNVGDAIRAVSPWGVDVASGVERSPGVKDSDLMWAFCDAVVAASRDIGRPP
jgi:phosphoribosylanthranilate isomerase